MRQFSVARRARRYRRDVPSGSQAGLTLVEMMIAAAILGIISVGILPLFARARLNNISGFDANQASHLSRSEVEDLKGLEQEDSKLNMVTPPAGAIVRATETGVGEEMVISQVQRDEGGRSVHAAPAEGTLPYCNRMNGDTPVTSGGDDKCLKLGDATWVAANAVPKGLVFWDGTVVIRWYDYADISSGVIDVAGTGELTTLGEAGLFDAPRASGELPAEGGQIMEQVITLQSRRAERNVVEVAGANTATPEMRFWRVY